MTFKHKFAAVALTASLSTAAFAIAQLPLHPVSVFVKGGLNFATSNPIDFNTGFAVGTGLDYSFTRNWRAGGSFDYLYNSVTNDTWHQYVGLINGYYDFTNLIPYVQPYLGLGIGYGHITSSKSNNASAGGVAFAAHLGFNYQLNQIMSLGAGYRLIIVSPSDSGMKNFINNSILASFTYRFGG